MTTLSEVPLASPPRSVRSGDVLVVLGLVAAELVLAWFTYDIGRGLEHHVSASRPVQWLFLMLPFLLLALVVTLHAVRPGRAFAAGLVALGAGAVRVGMYELTRGLLTHHPDLSHRLFSTIGYVSVMASATLAALAWGLSRRHGRSWLLGVLVAPAGAWLTLWTNWTQHVAWGHAEFVTVAGHDNPVRQYELVYAVSVMLPIIASCVVCWLIDAAELRRSTTAPSYDEGPPPR